MGGQGRGVEEQVILWCLYTNFKFDTLHRLDAKPTYNLSTNFTQSYKILSGMKVIIVVV